ncbi:hypothetical protein MLD38_002853 [Melastoma candidum]|uniref:Uncharacterized protein n=1 Tax=Melastoma candidum TaxID=119954 RepID=A0ACB9S994_9MYRT|nr:hypothetical protein MLD38_002853 [Melastoma candidum]
MTADQALMGPPSSTPASTATRRLLPSRISVRRCDTPPQSDNLLQASKDSLSPFFSAVSTHPKLDSYPPGVPSNRHSQQANPSFGFLSTLNPTTTTSGPPHSDNAHRNDFPGRFLTATPPQTGEPTTLLPKFLDHGGSDRPDPVVPQQLAPKILAQDQGRRRRTHPPAFLDPAAAVAPNPVLPLCSSRSRSLWLPTTELLLPGATKSHDNSPLESCGGVPPPSSRSKPAPPTSAAPTTGDDELTSWPSSVQTILAPKQCSRPTPRRPQQQIWVSHVLQRPSPTVSAWKRPHSSVSVACGIPQRRDFMKSPPSCSSLLATPRQPRRSPSSATAPQGDSGLRCPSRGRNQSIPIECPEFPEVFKAILGTFNVPRSQTFGTQCLQSGEEDPKTCQVK